MINPSNITEVRDSSQSNEHLCRIDHLPEFEQEDYDLSNPKDFEKYIKDVKSEIRNSFEYREMVKYLHNYGGMDRSGLNPEISNTDSTRVKIEIHHTPLVLEDIVKIVFDKRAFNHEDLSVQMVAKEVMECHYKGIIGLYPLSSTEHELVHNGYLFIPPSKVFGRYQDFLAQYDQYIDPSDKQTIEEIHEHEKNFNPDSQNRILSQSTVYLNTDNAYTKPCFDQFKEDASKRIDTIQDNMYCLPTL